MKDKELVEKLLEISEFEKLNPVQKEAIKKGLLNEKNLVIFAPTASGKTFCTELAAIKKILEKNEKVVYMVPLISLALEKYNEFKQKYKELDVKVAISIGDLDSSDHWLKNYDLIVVSNEKMDSLIRHRSEWVKDVGLVICDETHLLNDPSRGPTLEIILTLLKKLIPKSQFIALSATIKNAKELAEWLDAKTVVSEWRPVKLYQGVSFNSKIKFLEKEDYDLNESLALEASITENTIKLRKQALFFVATRRNAESLAEKLGKTAKKLIQKNEKTILNKISSEAENVLELPTRQCKRLANCIRDGTAFHHAGLLHKQKALIEQNFRNGLIKTIVATPTLAYGVNLPAFRVVMRDLKRYYRGIGSTFIPILEVHQMLGRCGRPKYDKFGEGVLFARSEEESDELMERYIFGEPEDIRSKLSLEPVLRMYTLSLIATGFCKSEKTLIDFFSKTFYAFQHDDISRIEEKILDILDNLIGWKFIFRKKERFSPTKIGRRVSELYIDPLTAHIFIQSLKRATKKKADSFSFLHTISNTLEMQPLLGLRSRDFSELNETIAEREYLFLQKIPMEWDIEFDDFLRSVKTTLMFEAWINESTEDQILSKFRVTPGELRSRLHIADWLAYSLQELSLLLGYKENLNNLRKTRVRLQYGVKEDIIPLVRLKNIGRVRARRLYSAGLNSIQKLRNIPLESLSRLIGPKIAYSIKQQLGQASKKIGKEKQKTLV